MTQQEMTEANVFARTTNPMYEQSKCEYVLATINKLAFFHYVTTDYLMRRSDKSVVSSTDDAEFEAFANDLSLQKWKRNYLN